MGIDLVKLAIKNEKFRKEVLDDVAAAANKYRQPLKLMLKLRQECFKIELMNETK